MMKRRRPVGDKFPLRRAVVRNHRRGLTPDEIGAELAISPTRVRWVLWREGEKPNRHPRPAPEPPRLPAAHPVISFLEAAPCPQATPWIALALGNPEDYGRLFRRVQQQLHRERKRGVVRAIRHMRMNYWALAQRMPMNLDEAKELIKRGVYYGTVYPETAPEFQAELKNWYLHTDGLPNVSARALAGPLPTLVPSVVAMGYTGDVCGLCGGSRMLRSGPSCLKCTDCGEAGGCG